MFSPGEWEGDLADADAREPLTRQQMKQLWVEEEEAREQSPRPWTDATPAGRPASHR